MKARIFAAVVGCLCCVFVSATGFSEEVTYSTMSVSRTVPWNALPGDVQSTVSQQSGVATLTGIQQTTQDGQVVYRAMFERNGEPMELLVSPDGSLFQNRTQLTWNDIPPATQQSFLSLFNLTGLFSIHQHQIAGVPVYDFGVNASGQMAHLQIDEEGTILNYFEDPVNGIAVESLTWDQLPVAVQDSVAGRIDSGQIDQIERGLLNGQIVYDISLNDGYTETQWRMASDGTVLSGGTTVIESAGAANVAQELELNQLPFPAQSVVASIAGADPIRSIRPVALDGLLCYEVAFTRAGEVLRIYVSQEGEILQ